MTDRTRLAVLQIVVVLGVCAFFFYFGLGAFGLVGADEPRYAQIAREMFQRHDWIVPTLNGSPWLEKPILLYWKVIGSYRIFGAQDWAARLPAAGHATALVLAVFFFMRRFRPGSELDAALITASMAGVIGFARGASADMLVSTHFCIAMLAWWTWQETEKKIWLAAFYALLAFGTLAKGPIAPALAVLIVGAYAWLRREGRIFLRSLWLPGFILFFAIALPWYIAVQVKVPQFFHTFFIQHNLERFGTNLYQHSQPFWYYIPVFLLSTVPWVAFTIPAWIEAARSAVNRVRAPHNGSVENHFDESMPKEDQPAEAAESGNDGRLAVFLLLWITIPILFFSISRSKLPGYILPAIPPAAVLTADYLYLRQKVAHLQMILHSLLCGAILALALLVPWRLLREPVPGITKNIVAVTSGVVAVVVLLIVRRGGQRRLHFATLFPMVLALAFLLRPAAPVIDETQSARSIDAQLRKLGFGATPVAVFNVRRDIAYGLTFYHNQPISYYEHEGPRDLPSGIPPEEHIVVAREGSGDAVRALAGERQVKNLGGFPPQHLEFFLVSNAK